MIEKLTEDDLIDEDGEPTFAFLIDKINELVEASSVDTNPTTKKYRFTINGTNPVQPRGLGAPYINNPNQNVRIIVYADREEEALDYCRSLARREDYIITEVIAL